MRKPGNHRDGPTPNAFEPDENERQRGRREWRGAFGSILLPLAIVLAVSTVVWQVQRSSVGGETTLVQLDAGRESDGDEREGLPTAGESAPAFALASLDGGQHDLSEFDGRPVIINFWATWCGPCRAEMPLLASYQERYAAEDLVVVGVNLEESRDQVATFVERYGLNFPVLLDTHGEVMQRYRVLGVPSSYFVGRDGIIRAVFFGPLEERDLERLLPAILAPGTQR